MNISRLGLVYISLLFVVVLALAGGAAQCQITSEQRLALNLKDTEAALELVCAMSGPQIATLASGKAVPLDDVGDASKAQILRATRKAVGDAIFHAKLENLSPDTKLGIEVKGEAILKLQNPRLGSNGVLRIKLNKYLPANVVAKVGRVADPPAFEPTASNLPSDPNKRIAILRELTGSMLSVVTRSQLGGRGIAFALDDLPGGIVATVASASPQQSQWLGKVYEAYRKDIVAQQVLLKQYEIANGHSVPPGTLVADTDGHVANPETTPSGAMPAWNDIAAGTSVRLYAHYFLLVSVISGSSDCGKGIGWGITTSEN